MDLPVGLVLDVDGVLVDVTDSYRRAICESVETVYGTTIERDEVQLFKDAGGFNNDWELTYAAALWVIAREVGYQANVTAYTERIAAAGGGIEGARAVIREDLPGDAQTVFDRWNPDRLRDVFQQLYLGADRYRDIEGSNPDPDLSDHPGYIGNEPVLADRETLDRLVDRFRVGVLTGRPAVEAAIALDRVGLDVPDGWTITMDDDPPGKPDPEGLITLAERMDVPILLFAGDTLDDVETAVRAGRADPDRTYVAIGVLSGGLRGATGRRKFEDAGADLIVRTVRDLPDSFENRDGFAPM